jgi:hypothetical protein
MAVLDRMKKVLDQGVEETLRSGPDGTIPIPKDVSPRLERGRARMRQEAAKRNECLAFWRGEQYRYVNGEGKLVSQPTVSNAYDRTGKPPHVIRRERNLYFDVIESEVASANQKVPGYEVSPSTPDPEDESAARLAQQVSRYGYDAWHVRRATEAVIRFAVCADEGFAWPYFDNSIGPFMDDGEGGKVGQGDIRLRTFSGNEVFWEPGVNFDDSRWHCVEQARDIEEVKELSGYLGGDLRADAQNSENGGERSKQAVKLVMVTEYLERPCAKYPEGRWLTFANERVIVGVGADGERPYPCRDGNGEVVDEPVIHRLSYAMDPDSDRDKGLGRHLLDAQRTINNSVNKETMWVDLAMNPQVIIWNGGFAKGQRLTNEPGAAYQATGTGKVEWRPVPEMPQGLGKMKQEAKEDMDRIAAQNDLPSGVTSGKEIQARIEREDNRRYSFIAKLAEFHSRLMRHCLYLVQKHYTEKRLIKIQGEFGADTIPDFLGAQLRSQVDVIVLPGSIEVLSRKAAEERIMAYAERGWISGQAAMAAIAGGNAESLIQSYQKDVSRAHQIIRKIKLGPEVLFSTPDRFEGGQAVPGWMPRKFDNADIQLEVIQDWCKTVEFDSLEPGMQEAAMTYLEALEQIKSMKLAEQAHAQQIMAESQGQANAAKPQNIPPPTPEQAAEGAAGLG